MGKGLTFFILLVALNAIICLLFLRSPRLLLIASDTTDGKAEFFPPTSPADTNANETYQSKSKNLPSSSAYSFNYIINPSRLCETTSGQSHKLVFLVLVHSATGNIVERQAIRTTWGYAATLKGNRGSAVRLAFLLGSTSNRTAQDAVRREADTHHDLIQADFVDSYQNLTLKSILMLKWTSEHCFDRAYFLFKTDDDMYINLGNLFKMASSLPAMKNSMYGVLFQKAPPVRNPRAKWFVPKSQFSEEFYPDYLSGTAYVMTMDVVPKVYRTSLTKPFMQMEDIFVTGICASAAGIKRFQAKGFSHLARPSTGCAFRDVVTGHHVTAPQMRQIWRDLVNKTKMSQCPLS